MKTYTQIFMISIFLLFNGCQTSHIEAGSGPITFSARTEASFQQYLAIKEATFFAVSTDGKTSYFTYCPHSDCEVNSGVLALRRCNIRSKGVPCKIYAVDRKVVWAGIPELKKVTKPKKELIGKGKIHLEFHAQELFKKYLEFEDPQFFALSSDGIYAYALVCGYNNPCIYNEGFAERAISGCESRAKTQGSNKKCYIYAKGRKIVWQ
tara:strand:- start:454 stop:1077 length:624 start_codon:yes stop_codon:yes gene_type:complete